MPTTPADHAVTALLQAWGDGDLAARDRLFPLIYAELRRRAAHYLRRERPGHTLQPTALVHEAYLRLAGPSRMTWTGRAHFLAVASQAMRRVLVDHARSKRAGKRWGHRVQVTLEEGAAASQPREVDLILLDESLDDLAALAPDQARLVELRYFGGLTTDEAAAVLGVSHATVERRWNLARAWLFRRVTSGRTSAADDAHES
ncbi:MAG TPA: sigma-70 family RNA polymerase sigma factor [Vicinamibacteria bacterium]